MTSDNPDPQIPVDLNALSAAVKGNPRTPEASPSLAKSTNPSCSQAAEDSVRVARIAELKSKFKARTLSADPASVASKLIDAHLKKNPPSQKI